MPYREELPDQCPPEAAEEITAEREVFRVVKSDPPTDGDFLSQRAMRPGAVFQGVPECLACGLSVFGERGDGEKALKLPGLRGGMLATVRLTAGAGRIQQTFRTSHHTWWPFAEFDILAHCGKEEA
jgi:hypothetical protein